MAGLDRKFLSRINERLALSRIVRDTRTDFILAPHFNLVFLKAGDELWERTKELLSSGNYHPELAFTVSVPKPRRFTRPGSILTPIDRLVYQALADSVAPTLESQMDRSRTFSHVLVSEDKDGHMFEQERHGWTQLQSTLRELTSIEGYFVKADVSNYFERIPQHHLINLMIASGCPTEIVRLLEEMLLAFQERDSFGIIQGVFPSDLLGNFYLSEIDAFCEMHGIPSTRFVDDLFLRYDSLQAATVGLIDIIDRLRKEGLHLNESKSGIRTSERVIKEESELDRLFSATMEEVRSERVSNDQDEEVQIDYGFAIDWELNEEEAEVRGQGNDDGYEDSDHDTAIERLYQSIDDYPLQADKIERFCLPFLTISRSFVGVERALSGIVERPHLARLYFSYLSTVALDDQSVRERLEDLVDTDPFVSDYQRMFLLGALTRAPTLKSSTINSALRILARQGVAQEVRALAAVLAARHGSPQQRRSVRLSYESEPSAYVRAAILYSSRHFTSTEQKICIKAWGGHNTLNALISHALRNS